MNKLIYISVAIFLMAIWSCCSNEQHDRLLESVRCVENESIDRARVTLSTVDASSLSDEDRHLYELMLLKLADFSRGSFTSDSIAQSLMGYYNGHGDSFTKSEVCYYSGLVYRSLGDAPQAVECLMRAEEELSQFGDTASNRASSLRSSVLFQLGELLLRQKLFSQALPVVKNSLRHALTTDNDSYIARSAAIVGATFHYMNMVDSAGRYYNFAMNSTSSLSDEEKAIMTYNLRLIDAHNGDFNAARTGYDDILRKISHSTHQGQNALNLGAAIYYNCNMLDSSRYCIDEILRYAEKADRIDAYGILLDINCRLGNTDSLVDIVKDYREASTSFYEKLNNNAIDRQFSLFNYNMRDRKVKDLTIRQQKWLILIVSLAMVCLVSIILIISLLYLNNKKKLNLSIAYYNIRQLEAKLHGDEPESVDVGDSSVSSLAVSVKNKIEHLRHSHNENISVPESITSEAIYKQLKSLVIDGRTITNRNLLTELDEMMRRVMPSFKSNLFHVLPSISESEYYICMLVKCGFTPTEISKLLSRSLSAISCSRSRMFERAFHYKDSPATWDLVISLI